MTVRRIAVVTYCCGNPRCAFTFRDTPGLHVTVAGCPVCREQGLYYQPRPATPEDRRVFTAALIAEAA